LHQVEFSVGGLRGQWEPRYAIHAGRHLNGKAFRSTLVKLDQTGVSLTLKHLSSFLSTVTFPLRGN